jgi:hypothetical protein
MFDKDAYLTAYLGPKARLRLTTLPDDLFERYAITLPSSDSDIAATLKEVRNCWRAQQPGSLRRKLAELCLAADEGLKREQIDSGPQHGRGMETEAWWQWKKEQQAAAARDRLPRLSARLKDSHGTFGVVPHSYLFTWAERLGLSPAQAEEAAQGVGLEVAPDVDIPDDPPIAQYAEFEQSMAVGQAPTVPELVHPGCRPFKILDRFESTANPELRLDVAGVRSQELAVSRQGTTAVPTARLRVLNILWSAAESGKDLRQIALYHLVSSVRGSVLGMAGIKDELTDRGVEEREANILAVVLTNRTQANADEKLARTERLLSSGRLREAAVIARGLPQNDGSAKQLAARIEEAQSQLAALLGQARDLLAVPDEIGAAAKVREARAISEEDADELLALVPLPPVRDLRADIDGGDIRLHWQPNAGHDADTAYQVVRSADGPPSTPAGGSPLPPATGTSATDSAAPVARAVHYSVFAVLPGRPSSRPGSTRVMSLPPVLDARMDTGPDWVSAHWSAHPGAHHVEAVRRDGGTATPIPVRLASARLTGLPTGRSVHIELTAVYERPEGGLMRSAPVTVSGTPREAAKPVVNLRALPITGSSGVQVQLTWTPVDQSEVRLKRSDSAPRWNPGEMLPPDEMTRWGDDVTGPSEVLPDRTRLVTTLSPGVHYVVPFSMGGTGIVVGRAVPLAVTNPVRGLTATAFSGFARLAWVWPGTSSLAEVSWERDDDGTDAVGLLKLSQAQYDTRGATVPLGPAPCDVSVRALMVVDGQTFASPPATIRVGQVARPLVAYTVESSPSVGPFGRRTKRLTLRAGGSTGPIRVALIAASGRVLPTEPRAGLTILDQTVTLAAGHPTTFTVRVPGAVTRPYWIRCFLLSGNAQLHDPPINTLREG